MGSLDRFGEDLKQNKEVQSRLVPGVGRMPFPAYRGNEPYIFVSYAHKDSEKVFREIQKFSEAGYHVWYDEGIAPGNEWTDEIADALAGCAVFVVMITPTSASRENVQNEINFALDEKKPFLAIHLEETELKRGLKLQIGAKQAILKYKMTEEEYDYKCISAFTRLGLERNAPASTNMSGGTSVREGGSGGGNSGSKKKFLIPIAALAALACCLVLFLVLNHKNDEKSSGAAPVESIEAIASDTEAGLITTAEPKTTKAIQTTQPEQTTEPEQPEPKTEDAAAAVSEEETELPEINIRRQPVSIACYVEDTAVFSVAADGYEISCQWYYKTENGSNWETWDVGERISFSAEEFHNKCRFRCEITDGLGRTKTSEEAELIIKPKIVLQPGNAAGKVGEDFTLTCRATGTGITYWWFYSANNGEKWSRWEEESMSASTNPIKKNRDGYIFKCVVRDANGTEIESNIVTLTVKE